MKKYLWLIIPLVICILILSPVFYLITEVRWTESKMLWNVLQSELSINTFLLMTGTALFSILFAVPTAFIQAYYTFRGKKLFSWLMLLPLSIPAYIAAYTYKGIVGAFGTTHAILGFYMEIENIFFLSMIMASVLYPYLYLMLRNSLRYNTFNLIEAAQSLGSSKMMAFWRIILPLSVPAIVSGMVIIMMEVLNNFGAVDYFGITTFTTEIIRLWSPMNSHMAIQISMVLLVVVLLIYAIEYLFAGKKSFSSGAVNPSSQKTIVLNSWKEWGAILVHIFPVFIGFMLPFVQLIFWALDHYEDVLDKAFLDLIINTFQLALMAIVSCLFCGLLFSISVRFFPRKWFKFLARLTTVGYALPGVVVAIGILGPIVLLKGAVPNIFHYLTYFLAFAYVVRFQAVSFNGLQSSLQKIPIQLNEASRSLSGSFFKSLWDIEIKLLKPALLSAALLIFVDVSKELPLTMMFQSFNFETLAVRSYMLMQTDGAVYQSAVPSVIIILIGLLPLVLIHFLTREK